MTQLSPDSRDDWFIFHPWGRRFDVDKCSVNEVCMYECIYVVSKQGKRSQKAQKIEALHPR